MIDNIIIAIEWSLIALFALIGYLYLVCSFIPHLTLRPQWLNRKGQARGVDRVAFDGGRGVVYEPDQRICRYIQKYALVLSDGHKFLQCRIDPHIRYMRYDVATFGRDGELLDIVRVCERPTVPGQTRRVTLPDATAHAYVVLRSVDGMYTNREKIVRYQPGRLVALFAATILSTMVTGWFLFGAVSRIWAACYPGLPRATVGPALLAAFLMGAGCAGYILLRHKKRIGKAVNK